jgi:protein-tyrosine phosphatase
MGRVAFDSGPQSMSLASRRKTTRSCSARRPAAVWNLEMKALLTLWATLLVSGVQICTVQAASVRRTFSIDSAAVHASGADYRVSWHAPGTHSVNVYAGTEPRHVGRGHPVATGGPDGSVTVRNLPTAARWYFELVPDHGSSLVLADRSLQLPSASNFRDVGGYRTEDGHWVRMGAAYRSNGLAALTASDYDRLGALDLKLVCDLRLEEERRKLPDPEIRNGSASVDTLWADVAADSGHRGSGLRVLMNSGDDVGVLNFMKGAYRDFVDLPSAKSAYHRLFMRLAEPGSLPTVFHCTAGKDRTGWAQAVLLTILHVPRKTIIEDYVLTDRYMSAGALEQIRKSMPGVDVAMSRELTAADPVYLQTAFAEVNERYGSFEGYLQQGLQLDARTIQRIRANFLQ